MNGANIVHNGLKVGAPQYLSSQRHGSYKKFYIPNSGGPLIRTPKAAPPGTSRVAVIRL